MSTKILEGLDSIDIEDLLNALVEDSLDDVKNTKTIYDIMNLHGALNRKVYIGDIGKGTGLAVVAQIQFWNQMDDAAGVKPEDRTPIRLYVDSYGGSVTETFAMMDAIALSKTPVWTICRSVAYSGGFFTFICGHKRFAYAHSSFLFHEGATQTSGDAHKFRNYADFYTHQLDQLKERVLHYTTITDDEYEKHRRDDWWMDADDAIKYGVADEIVDKLI